jgi:para-aminobenzoate synthetase component 1
MPALQILSAEVNRVYITHSLVIRLHYHDNNRYYLLKLGGKLPPVFNKLFTMPTAPTPYHIISIPYHTDSTALFNRIRRLPFACWLDSGKPKSYSGRFDVMTAQPSRRWVTVDGHTRIMNYQYPLGDRNSSSENENSISSPYLETLIDTTNDNALTLINQASLELTQHYQNDTPHSLPFTGGILAYFSYELGRQHSNIAQRSPNDCKLPEMVAGLYEWAVVQDHEVQTCYLVALPSCSPSLISAMKQHLDSNEDASVKNENSSASFSIGKLSANITNQQYHEKLTTINDYIHAGDCYQVNFAQCFKASYKGDPYIAYLKLREEMASPFSAFMDLGGKAILSLSPERFLQIQKKQVLTQPIKGTMARDNNPVTDRENAQRLQNSAKNQAENVMIVDLLRNDLGKNCTPGSIHVPALFALESFPNVHHLVSNIEGTLVDGKNAMDLFEGCFPGGSITGAPKKRAMEIIEELEDSQRSIYCGSIAYINNNGDMDSNITIRTIACDGETLFCWGGGGIVADSYIEEEYQESLTKIDKILDALLTFSDYA